MTLPLLAELTALVGGTVLTMAGAPEGPATTETLTATVATVLIQDGLILEIGPDLELPPGTNEIDMTGRFVMPGLIDGFVQFDGDHDVLYTAAGITTVRDMGGDRGRLLLQRSNRDRVPGPKLLTAGTVIGGSPAVSPEAATFGTGLDAERYLPILFAEQVDFLSLYSNLGSEPWTRTIELAHENGLEVWGPVGSALPFPDAVAAGQDGFLYMDSLLPIFESEGEDGAVYTEQVGWEIVQVPAFKKHIKALAESGAAFTPMLRATAQRTDPILEPEATVERYLRFLAAHYAGWWMGERDMRLRIAANNEGFLATGERVVKKQLGVLKKLDEAGVPLVPGSGSPHPWLMPGVGLVEELELWQTAGLSPERVLRAVTSEAAKELGLTGRGVLAPGAIADLICLDADPRLDIANLRNPSLVVMRGEVLDRVLLDELVGELLATMAARHAAEVRPLEVAEPDHPAGQIVMQGFVESRANGIRVSAERWCVVREPDGTIAFCGRVITPPDETFIGSDLNVIQRVRDGRLTGFQVALNQVETELMMTGLWAGERFNLERRLDSVFVDTKRATERFVTIDVGSVTSAMVLGHLERTGSMPALKLHEDFEPEVVTWQLEIAPSLVHLVRTSTGGMGFDFDEHGAVKNLKLQLGGQELDLQSLEMTTFGGPGLPVPAKAPTLSPPPGAETPAGGQ